MQSGENIQGLSKILDFIRLGSIFLLLFHFYCVCYPAFKEWGLTASIVDRLIFNLSENVFFLGGIYKAKVSSVFLLVVSLIGVKGKKSDKLALPPVLFYLIIGLVLFFISSLFLPLAMNETSKAELYMAMTSIGFLSFQAGGTQISRLLFLKYNKDIFNDLNETFPQEERLLENEFSVNIPGQYLLKGKLRHCHINIISPFRSTLISGTAGSGKSYFLVRRFIIQMIEKGYCLYLYDWKFPDLSIIAYNTALRSIDKYPVRPKFYYINFDDLNRSHRCNPLYPETMLEITDATESARTIMLSLNRQWLTKTGDFFVESPINFVTAIFWFLRKYEAGKYCTLPHAIEMAQMDYDHLFPVLSLEPECEVFVNPFISAYNKGALEQLEGQIASAKICLARLASPSLYYVLSGNDFTLDINNPQKPKLVCVGNNPTKAQTYGAVISLYTERMLKLVNRKGQLKSSLIFDEYPTIYADVGPTISTGRGNLISCTVCVQDISQLRKDYGKEQADVIMNVAGNIISGQVLGDTAKLLSERIGKTMQERESVSINSSDTSLSKSTQLESAIPASKIANLSSGQFVGAVADTPQQKIKLKTFHCEVVNDHSAIKAEEASYQELPCVRSINSDVVMQNYFQIKKDIRMMIDTEMDKIRSDPELKHLIAKRKGAKGSETSL